uniref:Uncharacterized protein n=1 Tax=Meloidogyne enterolobii TaxID=390850 RepID=A0A6V7UV46_MELEN|nr:unnamed protein product [Meloidogyne enterolobii]
MASNYQWYLYKKILLLEETDEESLYLTEDELEESINAEIRINASLLFATFQGIYDLFVEEVDDEETKELGNNIKNIFFNLIKKRIEIANCFICLYASLIDNEDLDEGLDEEEIETLIDKLKEMKFEDVIKACENSWVTKEEKITNIKKTKKNYSK